MTAYEMLTVFAEGDGGGNRVPVVLSADAYSDEQMQGLAQTTGLESAFLMRSTAPGVTGRLRYWVPNHEMSMCGHATVGTAWLLRQSGMLQVANGYVFETGSGLVRAGADDDSGWFEQALVSVEDVDIAPALDALGLTGDDLAGPPRNVAAPRVKTLIPLRDTSVLDRLDPDPARVEQACTALESSGLYPYVLVAEGSAEARQFPRSSGYAEDPATGIAAAALFFGLAATGAAAGAALSVGQGRVMGRPSLLTVSTSDASTEQTPLCRVSGVVRREP